MMEEVNIELGVNNYGSLLDAARNAAAVIGAVYQWLERVEQAGGATSVAGVAACNAMLKSLRSNEKRTDELIMKPLLSAIEKADAGAKNECVNAQDGNRPVPFDRETLGRMVREAWVRWAETQPNPKESWLAPYDDLAEPDKEADRQIGEAIARWTLIGDSARASRLAGIRRTNEGRQSFIYSNGVEMPYRATD